MRMYIRCAYMCVTMFQLYHAASTSTRIHPSCVYPVIMVQFTCSPVKTLAGISSLGIILYYIHTCSNHTDSIVVEPCGRQHQRCQISRFGEISRFLVGFLMLSRSPACGANTPAIAWVNELHCGPAATCWHSTRHPTHKHMWELNILRNKPLAVAHGQGRGVPCPQTEVSNELAKQV